MTHPKYIYLIKNIFNVFNTKNGSVAVPCTVLYPVLLLGPLWTSIHRNGSNGLFFFLEFSDWAKTPKVVAWELKYTVRSIVVSPVYFLNNFFQFFLEKRFFAGQNLPWKNGFFLPFSNWAKTLTDAAWVLNELSLLMVKKTGLAVCMNQVNILIEC